MLVKELLKLFTYENTYIRIYDHEYMMFLDGGIITDDEIQQWSDFTVKQLEIDDNDLIIII